MTTVTEDIFEAPDGPREQILAATYRTLRKHGYSDLTIERIGEEFPKSTSLLYYHYEDKDEVVLATLEYLLDVFETQFTTADIENPRTHLETFLTDLFEAPAEQAHLKTLLELRARASHDEQYQQHFNRSDRVFEAYLARVLQAGIDAGQFNDVNPQAVARTLTTLFSGLLVRASTDDTAEPVRQVREEIDAYLEARVYREATDEPSKR